MLKSFENALQIYTIKPQTNCRKCFLPTCMAFAGAVLTGAKKLSDCPYIPAEILEEFGEQRAGHGSMEENVTTTFTHLRAEMAKRDLCYC